MYWRGAPSAVAAGVFCQRVLAKSNGKTHVTPTIPAIDAFIILGTRLFNKRYYNHIKFINQKDKINYPKSLDDIITKQKSYFNIYICK